MPSQPEVKSDADDAAKAPPEIPAEKIFGTAREIAILHDGIRYRLRITRKNKLILQK